MLTVMMKIGKAVGIRYTRKQWLRYLEIFAYLVLPALTFFFIEIGFFSRKPSVIVMVAIFSVIWLLLFFADERGVDTLEQFAEDNRFSAMQSQPICLESFARTHLASFGKKIEFLVYQKQKNVEIYVFNHSLGFKHPNVHTVFLVFSKHLNLPHFVIGERTSAEDIFYNHLNDFSELQISIYDDPDFSRSFVIKGKDIAMINAVLEQDVRSVFAELKDDDLYFEGVRNCFLVHKYRRLDINECNAMYLTCKGLFQNIYKKQVKKAKKSAQAIAKQDPVTPVAEMEDVFCEDGKSTRIVPADKSDFAACERLSAASDVELEAVLDDLLEWLQDINWPVAPLIISRLSLMGKALVVPVRKILAGTDEVWKYWIISSLCPLVKVEVQLEILDDLKKIAYSATESEKAEEVDQVAGELLTDLKNKGVITV